MLIYYMSNLKQLTSKIRNQKKKNHVTWLIVTCLFQNNLDELFDLSCQTKKGKKENYGSWGQVMKKRKVGGKFYNFF